MFRKLLVLVAIIGLCVSQKKDYNMTLNETISMVQGLFKSLKVSDDKDSIHHCVIAGIAYKDLVDHDFSGVISESELGPQINQKLLANVTKDFFNHTTLTVQQCGNLSVGVYKLLIKLFKFIIDGNQWMGALRRLKDNGFTILGSLGVGFRMLDEKKFYEAGIEFGVMAQELLFGTDSLRMNRMLSMSKANIYDIMKARRAMRYFQKVAVIAINTDKSVWIQILDGIVKALDDNTAVEDGKKCVKSVNNTVAYFRNIKWSEQQSVENVTTTIQSTGNNFVSVVDLCTQGVNKVIRVGGVSIDFFKKITGNNVLSVLYNQMQMIADSDIEAFKMIFEKRDFEGASQSLAKQVIDLLKLIRANELH